MGYSPWCRKELDATQELHNTVGLRERAVPAVWAYMWYTDPVS